MKKLDELKFGHKLCTWLQSYLTDRTQKTFAVNVTSPSRIVPYRVPQGSVLGPLLIIIYPNDLDLDTNPNDFQRVQQDVSNITEWCQINELTINCKKTKVQFFPRNRIFDCKSFKEQYTIKLQGQEVGYTDIFRYLGVEIAIDDLLSMKSHVNRVNKNASHKLFLLRKLRHVLNTHAPIMVLKSMFLGVLDYGLLFTTVVPIKMFNDLQTIQNHALRYVLNVYDPHDLHVNQLQFMTL